VKLYNTLTKQIENLTPIDPPTVKIYTCGPTVYDYPHIGNWFTFIRYDLLIRTLKAIDLKPIWIMNITDVGHLTSDANEGEDKLEKGASREGKSAWAIADFYTDYFIHALDQLNFTKPQKLPRATEHIKQQIALIKNLETKGYTYQITDGIYFDTAKFPNYANFAQLDLEEQQAGIRVDYNPEKKNTSDFALWKFSPTDKKRAMEWNSPWGIGFPGWHIECSAMCLEYLGPTIDIHSGGIDHIPIHHTNEVAQSEAANSVQLAKIWMHTNHILIEEQKISKSLGNGITLEDIKKQNINLQALRLLVIESHYRSQSKFSWDSLKAAENRLLRYYNFAARLFQPYTLGNSNNSPRLDLVSALSNDLNTPLALKQLEEFIDNAEENTIINYASLKQAIDQIDNVLGLTLTKIKDIDEKQKNMIKERESARKQKDWSRADQLRAELASTNISILDSSQGPIWQYLKIP